MTFDDSDPSRRHRTVSWTDIEIVKAYAAKEDYLPIRRKPSFSIARRGPMFSAMQLAVILCRPMISNPARTTA